jgi:RNA polymerase sigma-70 factor (ECF subfamily)
MSESFGDGLVALMPELRRYALRLTGSSHDADDLVQEAIVRAWRFRASFQPGSSLGAWLFRIARNQHIGDRRRVLETALDPDDDFWVSEPEQEWKVRVSEVGRAVATLPLANRQALLLVAGLGYSCEEAAAVMGCPVGTTKGRVSRARRQLLVRLSSEPEPRSGPTM